MSDPVNHPAHYQRDDGFECIELVELLPFCEGNAIKYIFRAGRKGDAMEDLRKALWYAERATHSFFWWPRRPGHTPTVERACMGFDSQLVRDAIRHLANGEADAAIPSIKTLIEITAIKAADRAEELEGAA